MKKSITKIETGLKDLIDKTKTGNDQLIKRADQRQLEFPISDN